MILIVEDDPLILILLAEQLEDAGYITVSALNADDALKIMEAQADVELIITDIDMPGSMNGLILAAAVRDRWPPVDIIITTGKEKPEGFLMPSDSVFLGKPYHPARLLEAVRSFN